MTKKKEEEAKREEAEKRAAEEKKKAEANSDDGKTFPPIEEAKKAAKEIRDATAAQKLENDRTEKIAAEAELGGQSKMSPTIKPKKLTDTEYAEALEKGKVNPLKEDGFIK